MYFMRIPLFGLGLVLLALVLAIRANDEAEQAQADCEDCEVKEAIDTKVVVVDKDGFLLDKMGARIMPKPSPRVQAEIAAARQPRLNTWLGCSVVPCGVTNVPAGLEHEICAAFRDDRLVPQARIAYFAWLLRGTDKFAETYGHLHHVGWSGAIASAIVEDNHWVVEVRFRPRLAAAKMNIPYTPDVCYETWHYSKSAGLKYISNREPEKGRLQFISSD